MADISGCRVPCKRVAVSTNRRYPRALGTVQTIPKQTNSQGIYLNIRQQRLVHTIGHAVEFFEVFGLAVTAVLSTVLEHVARLPGPESKVHQGAAISRIGVKRLQVKGYRIAGVLLLALRPAETVLLGLVLGKSGERGVGEL